MKTFEVADNDFSVEEIIDSMGAPEVGAVIAYIGVVRGFSKGKEVAGIEFDRDEAAIDKVRALADNALNDFEIEDVAIVHRVGQMAVGEKLLLIAISTAHRQPALDACASIIDGIKEVHSGWGKETYK